MRTSSKPAHVASHDLKEPVRKIKTFSFRLQDALSETTNPEINLYVGKILKSAERMSLMIEGVLKYSTIDESERGILRWWIFKKTLTIIENDLVNFNLRKKCQV